MDPPENSNVTEKSWDHPWTTDEMRQHRNNWSLAADAGLLKHLQQFSDNITEQVHKTQEKLNSLASDLNEASVIIDNVTNASLALANTQFIESRVYEDDVETARSEDTTNQSRKNEQLDKDDLIASVSESIKQCLIIMDEKFQRVEVLASDSEDEGEAPTPSVILQPKDPYKDRPLPYAIGAESDSEPAESEEDSPSDIETDKHENRAIVNNRRESPLRRTLSSSSESSDRHANMMKNHSDVSSRNDKLEARSQDTLNSGSEITTPGIILPTADNSSTKGEPNFAEELAKRLGNVTNRPVIRDNHEADQSSINRSKDDLFAPNDDNDVFSSKADNLFSDGENLFEDDVSTSLWKNKPYKPPKTNMIPPSLDVPPPMTSEVKKPKSAFDDLYGEGDSEDSDDIFAPRSSMAKSTTQRSISTSDEKSEITDSRDKKLLNVARCENAIATSTPETHDNGGLFGDENDDDNDDDDLFGSSVKSSKRITERSPESTRAMNRTMPPGLAITQADILSSNLGSRLFQRMPRENSSDSSEADPSLLRNPDFRVNDPLMPESDSSGISIRPNSINNTFGLGVDFQPQSESTRLRSEEIYRERLASDSLFEGRSSNRNPESSNSGENSRANEARIIESPDEGRNDDDDFDSDDVFGPPPLSNSNENVLSKSELTSNEEDLFSTSDSYVSRSSKSFDLLATSKQYDVKVSSERGLFDEEIDIFGGGADEPEVDIFGEAFKSTLPARSEEKKLKDEKSAVKSEKTADLFDSSINASLSGEISRKKIVDKPRSIFDDSDNDDEDNDDDDDLFGPNFFKNQRKIKVTKMHVDNDDEIFAGKTTGETSSRGTKKDFTSSAETASDQFAKDTSTNQRPALHSNSTSLERHLPNYTGGGLFDNLDDDNENTHDSLFAVDSKKSHDNVTSEKINGSKMSEVPESKFVANRATIGKLLEGKKESREKVSEESGNNYESGKIKEISSKIEDDAKNSLLPDSTEIPGESSRREPPKTLSIRLPMPSGNNDDTSQSRPAVSDKIKNLQAKMGDLKKILSPTDTPPLWRKNKDKIEQPDDEKIDGKDCEDGASMSASKKSPTVGNNEDEKIFADNSRDPAPNSPLDDSGNSESAVSFDVPVQVEVLAVTASKSRARIQAKRRPQSRHARQSALRKSGIDFDAVDNSSLDAGESDLSENTFSGISDNIPTVVTDDVDVEKPNHERLAETSEKNVEKIGEAISTLAPEDKSEFSMSKGSSLSLNKNTLLSPSTDEEDLFDVPPDLPEDPPKEDTLFGRAPILSPIDRSIVGKTGKSRDRKNSGSKTSQVPDVRTKKSVDHSNDVIGQKNTRDLDDREKSGMEKMSKIDSSVEKPTDPLRDDSHDPLKDPSQLFAFVTKTPSPEKGQNVSFKEDSSLFTHLAKKSAEEARSAATKKPILDLFNDDTGGDLFSSGLSKTSKKSIKREKNLFDDTDEEEDGADDLFGSRGKSSGDKIVDEPKKIVDTRESSNRSSLFAADDDDDLFADKKTPAEMEKSNIDETEKLLFPTTSKISKDAKIRDIFGDQSSGEEDIFGNSKIIGSAKNSNSIFTDDPDDDDSNDIFTKKNAILDSREKIEENRLGPKKTVTRDLKKTAEKIVKDPLSMLQDD